MAVFPVDSYRLHWQGIKLRRGKAEEGKKGPCFTEETKVRVQGCQRGWRLKGKIQERGESRRRAQNMAANFSLVVHREEFQDTQHKATVGAKGRADILETSRAGKTEISLFKSLQMERQG